MAKIRLQKKEINETVAGNYVPSDFGGNLYTVKVIPSVSKEEKVTLYADRVNVTEKGDLLFFFGEDLITTFGTTQWKACYMVDPDYQNPLNIIKWEGVAGVKILPEKVLDPEAIKALLMGFIMNNEDVKSSVINSLVSTLGKDFTDSFKGDIKEMGKEIMEELLEEFTVVEENKTQADPAECNTQ